MFVTVKYQDQAGQEAVVSGIFATAAQAVRMVDDDQTHGTDAFAWPPTGYGPEIGEAVSITAGQIVPNRGMQFLDVISRFTRRHEVRELQQECNALKARTADLQKKLARPQRVFHDHLLRECKHGQAREILLARDQQTARENLVADVVRKAELILHETVVLVAKEQTAHKINELVQENLYEKKLIDGHKGIAHHDSLLHTGDRVIFSHANGEVRDGDLGDIIHFDVATRTLIVALDRRGFEAAELVHVPLREHDDVRLGYATTFGQASKLTLYEAIVLAEPEHPTAPLVDSLQVKRVAIYTDHITAAREFPQLLSKHQDQQPSVSPHVNPLLEYMRHR